MSATLARFSPRAVVARDEPGRSIAAVSLLETAALQLDVIGDLDGLAAIEHDWRDLFDRAGRSEQVFQTFDWIWQWACHLLPAPGPRGGSALTIVVGRRNGRLLLVWPLVMERRAGVSILSWAGDPVSQYGDVLVDDIADRDALLARSWQFINERLKPDIVHLRKVRSDAAVAPLLVQQQSRVLARMSAPFLDLKGARSYEDYEQRYAAKARKNRRRLMRRLEERGAVQFETLAGCPAAGDRSRLAISLKRAWLKQRGLVSPALQDERVVKFFERVTAGGPRCPGSRVSTLLSNGEATAIEIAFPCKGRLAVHVIVYGLKFEKSGAGGLLLEKCISRAIEDGMSTIDLLAPGDAYKMDWADGAVEVADHAAPLNTRGSVYAQVYLGFIRARAKALIERLPLSLRRTMATGLALALSLA